MKVVGGCDAGGTKTRVRIVSFDEHGAVSSTGEAESGAANLLADPAMAIDNVRSAVDAALLSAGLPVGQHMDGFVAAMAGAGRPNQRHQATQALRDCLSVSALRVVTDADVLFAEFSDTQSGVALVVGTGSIAWARDGRHGSYREGGWGPLVGDEGSGYWLGLQAIKRAVEVLHHDGDTTGLTACVLDHFQQRDLDGLIQEVYAADTGRARIASLAVAVCEQAERHDDAARILSHAADQLSRLMVRATARMRIDRASEPVNWICAGSVIVNQSELRTQIQKRCERGGLCLSTPHLVHNPVGGAVAMARELVTASDFVDD